MKLCKITDETRHISVGLLYFYEKSDTYIIELSPDLSLEDAPIFFDSFLRRKKFTVGPAESRRFVESRIVPRDRQNLRSILENAGMREYEPFRLLLLAEGRCSQDDCVIRPISSEPDWMAGRKKQWLVEADALPDRRYYFSFRDGTEGIAALEPLVRNDRTLAVILQKYDELSAAKLIGGGRTVDFGSGRILMSNAVYDNGLLELPRPGDREAILQGSLVDVPDLCSELGVSRQYINRRIQEEGIQPFRKCGGNNLYLRKDVFALFDY